MAKKCEKGQIKVEFSELFIKVPPGGRPFQNIFIVLEVTALACAQITSTW